MCRVTSSAVFGVDLFGGEGRGRSPCHTKNAELGSRGLYCLAGAQENSPTMFETETSTTFNLCVGASGTSSTNVCKAFGAATLRETAGVEAKWKNLSRARRCMHYRGRRVEVGLHLRWPEKEKQTNRLCAVFSIKCFCPIKHFHRSSWTLTTCLRLSLLAPRRPALEAAACYAVRALLR